MSTRKKRRENDLPITWYINKKVGQSSEPFNLEGIPLLLEVAVGFKKYYPEFEVEGNGVIFTFWGKDQDRAGQIVLTLWGNYGKKGMWAIDTKEVTELVHHSWLETDNPDPVGVLVGGVELTSVISLDRGPRGYSAYEIAVQNGYVGTEEEWLSSLVGRPGDPGRPGEDGQPGPPGPAGGVYWPEIYVDSDLWIHIVEPVESLGARLFVLDGYLYAID